MKCSFHPTNIATAMCISCKCLVCDECAVKIDGKNYCTNCVIQSEANYNSVNPYTDYNYQDANQWQYQNNTNESVRAVKEMFSMEQDHLPVSKTFATISFWLSLAITVWGIICTVQLYSFSNSYESMLNTNVSNAFSTGMKMLDKTYVA